MFLISIVFATIMPVSNIFSFLYFFLKFYIEKYNMIFVYLKEYEAKGKIRHGIMPIQLFSIVFSQILNYAFFSANDVSGGYLKFGIPVVVIQVVGLIVFRICWERYR
jgi:hypothetical protein